MLTPDLTRLATMLPLEYQEDGVSATETLKGRVETCVCYFSKNWEELVEILEMPQEFFLTAQSGWKQDRDKRRNWKIQRPCTAILEPAWASLAVSTRVLSFLKETVEDNRYADVSNMIALEKAKGRSLEIMPSVRQFFESGAHEGFFLAEFAISTATLHVLYVPPTKRSELYPRYKSDLSDQTLATITASAAPDQSSSASSLHFDLGTCPPPRASLARDRAEMIVDCLESRQNLCELLNKDLQLRIINPQMIPKHSPMPYEVPRKQARTKDFVPSLDAPRIIAEGLSSELACCVCTVGKITETGPDFEDESLQNKYILEDLMFKIYCSTPPG